MNKRDILSFLDGEERILISRVMDLCNRCERYGAVTYTPFLNPREIKLAKDCCKGSFFVRYNGGYADAERVMMAFCPYEDDVAVFPLTAVKISVKDGRVFSHRDYLGALLSLGIKREKLGDIIVRDDFAVVFCETVVAEYVCLNLDKVASSYVKCEEIDDVSGLSLERNFQVKSVTVASMRIDGVLSSATVMSREESAAAINRGYVQLNYETVKSVSAQVKDGDVISARGYGKMQIETTGETTRKGRIKVNIKHFK